MADAPLTLGWAGEDGTRMEVAHVERRGNGLVAEGTQLGAVYELHYRLEPRILSVHVVGVRSCEFGLDRADFFDLAWSPLFNSLPVIRDGLLDAGPPRRYVMRWVDVPSLEVHDSEQWYEPRGGGTVGFRAGGFAADIQFDADGFAVNYPGLARRL